MKKLLILSCVLLMLVGCGGSKQNETTITPTDNPLKTGDTVPVNEDEQQPLVTDITELIKDEDATKFGRFYLLNEYENAKGIAITEDNYMYVRKPMVDLPEGYQPEPLTFLKDGTAGKEITMDQAEEIIKVLIYIGQQTEMYPFGTYQTTVDQVRDIGELLWGDRNHDPFKDECVTCPYDVLFSWFTIVDKNGTPTFRLEISNLPKSLNWYITEYTDEIITLPVQEREGIEIEHIYDGSVPFEDWYAERFD